MEAILARLTVPPADVSGAFAPVEETAAWRGGEPPPVDWTSMPPSCDPAALTHDGREAAVASGNARENPVVGAPATVRSFTKKKTETPELSTRARRNGGKSSPSRRCSESSSIRDARRRRRCDEHRAQTVRIPA